LKTEIATPQGPSRLSKFLLAAVPAKFTTDPDIEKADVIVLLDTNTIQQLGDWSERVKASKAALIVIDHHASHPETEQRATLTVADEKASSASEIVYRLFKEAEVKPAIEMACIKGYAQKERSCLINCRLNLGFFEHTVNNFAGR